MSPYKLENYNELTAELFSLLDESEELVHERSTYKEGVYDQFLEHLRPCLKELGLLHKEYLKNQKLKGAA